MKLKFNPNLDFQKQAIGSVVDLFVWSQKVSNTIELFNTPDVFANDITINNELIQKNLATIQEGNDIATSPCPDLYNFTVEMETGTWKTYVYLRTIMELNQQYWMSKFIIIVPSLPIRAWVLKSLEMTKTHFKELYPTINYDYYDYDSSKLKQMEAFAEHSELQIMVITYQAFNSKDNVIHQTEKDKEWFGEESLMQKIARTRPILILDEPQSIEWAKTKAMMKLFDPLFTLRYSATHKHDYSMTYRLTPAQAYRAKLVKWVRVIGIEEWTDSNLPQLECLSIDPWTKITTSLRVVDNNWKAKKIKCKQYDDLEKKSKNWVYKGYIIENISRANETITFMNGQTIKIGESYQQDTTEVMKAQIRNSIQAHMQRRAMLRELWIKPLCLFFIDKVASFIGEGERIQSYFSEQVAQYSEIQAPKSSYAYYFAGKKNKKTWETTRKDTLWNNAKDREIEKEMYRLIMSEKEELLWLHNTTEFIFSHSALKEWRDNPNIFTICTLKTTHSESRKRQEIGRWMRLPVNQDWERVYDDQINKLVVVPNESYKAFVEGYQHDMEKEWYTKKEANEAWSTIENAKTIQTVPLNEDESIQQHMSDFWNRINQKTYFIVSLSDKDLIRDCILRINEELNYGSVTKVRISRTEAEMIVREDDTMDAIETDGESTIKTAIHSREYLIPWVLTLLQQRTNLSKKTLAKIRAWIELKDLFAVNPMQFASLVSWYIKEILQKQKSMSSEYHLSKETYKIEWKKSIEIDTDVTKTISTLQETLWGKHIKKSMYDLIVVDSTIEEDFWTQLANDSNILFFFKIPSHSKWGEWFNIRTPVGRYSPDRWIVVNNKESGLPELHFVVENKWTVDYNQLKSVEQFKISCAKKHFNTLKKWVKYNYFKNYDVFKKNYLHGA